MHPEKRNMIGMLGLSGTATLLRVFISIFLVAQVFFITDYNLASVTLFILVEATAIFLFYAFASFICKRVQAIWVIRLSIVLVCGFLILLVLWQDGLRTHFMVFGLLWGTIQGFYWGAYNFLISSVFGRKRVKSLFIKMFVLNAFVTILFPFTLGFAIDFGSWLLTSGLVLGVGVLQFSFSFVIKAKVQENQQLRPIEFFRALKKSNHLKPSMKLWFVVFLGGIPFPLTTLMTILIIKAYGTNIGIGLLGSIFAAVGVVALLVYRYSKPGIKPSLFLTSCVLPLLASIGLFFYVGPLTVIIFNAALVLPKNIVNVEENSTRINATRNWGGEEFMIESHLFYEFALFVGRLLSCGILLLVAAFGTTQILLATGLCIILFAYTVHSVLLFLWNRRKSIDNKTTI